MTTNRTPAFAGTQTFTAKLANIVSQPAAPTAFMGSPSSVIPTSALSPVASSPSLMMSQTYGPNSLQPLPPVTPQQNLPPYQPPPQASGIPWGTIAIGGAVGIAAIVAIALLFPAQPST